MKGYMSVPHFVNSSSNGSLIPHITMQHKKPSLLFCVVTMLMHLIYLLESVEGSPSSPGCGLSEAVSYCSEPWLLDRNSKLPLYSLL